MKNGWTKWYSSRSIKVPREAEYWMTHEVIQYNIENEENASSLEGKFFSPLYKNKGDV